MNKWFIDIIAPGQLNWGFLDESSEFPNPSAAFFDTEEEMAEALKAFGVYGDYLEGKVEGMGEE